MKVLEGAWDCSNCLTVGIPGLTTNCPQCGDPRNTVLTPEEKPYLPTDGSARVLTTKEELDYANSGPEWNCGHCGSVNRGDTTSCKDCGRSLDADDTVNRRTVYDDRETRFDAVPDPMAERLEDSLDEATRVIEGKGRLPRRLRDLSLRSRDLPARGAISERFREYERAAEDRRTFRPADIREFLAERRIIAYIGGGAAVVILALTAFFTIRYFTATTEGSVTIEALRWERSTEVEEFRTLTESGWDYPSDARVISSSREIRSYRTVHDGYRTEYYTDYETRSRSEYKSKTCHRTVDNGNGTFSQDSYECGGMETEYFTEPVQKSRQVEITHEEPVYDRRYRYEIDRWAFRNWVTISGDTPEDLVWPEPTGMTYDPSDGDQLGEIRKGDGRQATYTIVYVDDEGTSYSQESSSSDTWSHLEIGESVKAAYNKRTGQLSNVDWESATRELS